jgi:hypothetical protein
MLSQSPFSDVNYHEPFLFTRNYSERVHRLSNPCTHRANFMLDSAEVRDGDARALSSAMGTSERAPSRNEEKSFMFLSLHVEFPTKSFARQKIFVESFLVLPFHHAQRVFMSCLDQHRDADRGIEPRFPRPVPSCAAPAGVRVRVRGALSSFVRGADAALDRVEREDEVIVENASAASAPGITSAGK